MKSKKIIDKISKIEEKIKQTLTSPTKQVGIHILENLFDFRQMIGPAFFSVTQSSYGHHQSR